MLDHVGIPTSDYQHSLNFYQKALAALGIKRLMEVGQQGNLDARAAGFGHADKPYFWFGDEGAPVKPTHVAFAVDGRAKVKAFHTTALAAGGRDHGAPSLRPHHHANYYAAFVLDPDGHNVEAVCHLPETNA